MGTQAVMQKIEITIPQEKLVRVLVIDDDDEFQTEMKEFFEGCNCSVDVASSLEEGRRHLEKGGYEIVIADVNFDTSRIKGDRFVLDNEKRMGKARIIVVTGQGMDTIDKYKQLKKRGIGVFEKSDDSLGESLEAIAQEKFVEREATLVHCVRETISSSLGAVAGAAVSVTVAPVQDFDAGLGLLSELKEMLIQWLESRSRRDERVLAFGSTVFTPNEMIREIETDTDVGLAHIRMLVAEIKASLGLTRNDT